VNDKYLDAIINEDGSCWVVVDNGTEKSAGLPSLMREGWKPIRETPYVTNRGGFVSILICLERV